MIIFLADKTEYAESAVFTALLRLLQESNQSVSHIILFTAVFSEMV